MAIAVEDIPRALLDAARRSLPSLSLPHARYVELFGGEVATRLVMPPAVEVGELSDEQASALVRSPYLRGAGASSALRQLVAGIPEPVTARVSIRMSRRARALFGLKAALLAKSPADQC